METVHLKINNIPVEVPKGYTILQAAKIDVNKVYPTPNIGQANGAGSKLRIASREIGLPPPGRDVERPKLLLTFAPSTVKLVLRPELPEKFIPLPP